MKRTVFKKKSTAKKYRGAGRRVYPVKGGYVVSPECPRSVRKRATLIKQRPKTKRKRKFSDALYIDIIPF